MCNALKIEKSWDWAKNRLIKNAKTAVRKMALSSRFHFIESLLWKKIRIIAPSANNIIFILLDFIRAVI